MKYCAKPFEHLYIKPDGSVSFCGWNGRLLGNLVTQDIDEIWNSAAAEEVRESFRNGTMLGCSNVYCPRCNNDQLEDVDESEVAERFKEVPKPISFNLAIDYTCNHSCPSCRHEIFVPDEQYNKNLDIMIEKLMPYLQNAKYISTDGQGDIFASPKLMKMLENLHPTNPDFELVLETNGVLCDEAHWKRLAHLEKYKISMIVTPNSFERATYKALSGGHDDLDRVLKNLAFISKLRREEIINHFAISFVSQDRNFRELPAFARRCFEEFNADRLTLKPIYKWFKMTASEYLQKDILNPEHPYFDEYQDILKDPLLKDPRVFWWGADHTHPAVKLDGQERKLEAQYETSVLWAELLIRNPHAITDWLKKCGYEKVGIYGYGRMGMMLSENLGDLWNNVVVAVRPSRIKAGTTYVRTSEDKWPGKEQMDLLVVSTVYDYDSIQETARGKTDAEVISLDCLLKKIAKEGCCCD